MLHTICYIHIHFAPEKARMTQEEIIITAMREITLFERNQIGNQIETIENLLVRRRLFRKWVQDAEGADLFSAELAEVEAELAEKEDERETLLEQYNRYERKCNWLRKQLEIIRFQSGHEEDTDGVTDDDDVPF